MKTDITYENFPKETVVFRDDAVGFYTDMAEYLTNKCTFLLSDRGDQETINLKCEKGTLDIIAKNRSGSITLFEEKNGNHMNFDMPKKFDSRYLKMLNADYNNYKFYKLEMINNDPNQIQASWGRIGDKESKAYNPYTLSSAIIKASEKLAKGYQDFSEIYYDDEINPQDYVKQEDKDGNKENKENSPSKTSKPKRRTKNVIAAEELYNQLLNYSKKVIRENFYAKPKITKKMIDTCQNLFNSLQATEDIAEFNKILKELMLTAERRITKSDSVGRYFAETKGDFQPIIDREESILMSMQVVNIATKEQKTFPDWINVKLATEKEKETVLNNLDSHQKAKVVKVYRIENTQTSERFKKYTKENNIKTKKLLWHGSRNENWLSIANKGLLLNPDAVITGKMYGNGIYFSTDSDKSYGYTSGGYWNGGHSNTRFMALYETAYGTPEYEHGWRTYTKEMLQSLGKDCVHALGQHNGGTSLRRDEIIFFDESAINLKYLVEFDNSKTK